MRTDTSDRKLRRTVRMMRAWRALGLMGWLFFFCSLAYISFSGRSHQARAIKVDDQVVVWVKDERAAERVLEAVRERKKGDQFAANVSHETLPLPQGTQVLSERQAIAELSGRLPVLVAGCTIVLEGKDIVTMDTEEHAENVLQELKTRYAALKEGERIITQRLEPQPELRETTVPPTEVHTDIQSAAEMLQSSKPQTVPYVVQPGDSPSLIAQKHGVRLADLVAQNPSLKQVLAGERYLRPNEKLSVTTERRGVKVITDKVYQEEIPEELAPLTKQTPDLPKGETRVTNPGKPALKKVTVTVTLVNDKVVSRKEDKAKTVLLEPGVRERMLVGTGPPRPAAAPRGATPSARR